MNRLPFFYLHFKGFHAIGVFSWYWYLICYWPLYYWNFFPWKSWKKWTAMYWFAHKAYSTVIRGWIRQIMKLLENWWLSGSEIRQVAIPYMFPPFPHTFPHVSLCFCIEAIIKPNWNKVCKNKKVSLGISNVSSCVSPCFQF